ncbi:hypothetical protein SADUNF_Sadunf19G0090300 [Salix dunnii]|uniref:Uncharacterized protein n=1 Tax=Salix dunnii TaxID=1413687 RepID=A0A835J6B0_9ROSI|nr:hypothetical protein SADUNF_Sadunf19G0090300 [Salix dunnii]
MLLQTTISSSPPLQHHHRHPHSLLPLGFLKFRPHKLPFQHSSSPDLTTFRVGHGLNVTKFPDFQDEISLEDGSVIVIITSLLLGWSEFDEYSQALPRVVGVELEIEAVQLEKTAPISHLPYILPSFHMLHSIGQIHGKELAMGFYSLTSDEKSSSSLQNIEDNVCMKRVIVWASALSFGKISLLTSAEVAHAGESIKPEAIYEVGELFELGIQLSYLLLLLTLLGVGTFFVIRQVLMRRELDLSAKELQASSSLLICNMLSKEFTLFCQEHLLQNHLEQVRSGDATATGLFELGAVMLRRKFYPAATRYLLQAIEKWDGDDQDLAQSVNCNPLPACTDTEKVACMTNRESCQDLVLVYNALGVSYVLDGKLDRGIKQFEAAVKLQPGYVTAWNNLGDAYEKKKDLKSALKAFEEVLLFDPSNKVARPRRDALRDKVQMYKGVPIKSKDR